MMKVYDVFIFNNEFDLLDIRLSELNSIVDEFVLIEAPLTHTHLKKPLYYKESGRDDNNVKSFQIPLSEIDGLKLNRNIHYIEKYQRNYIANYLKESCKDEDIVIFSDIDEIPKLDTVMNFIKLELPSARFRTMLCRYYCDLFFQYWEISHIFRWKALKGWLNNLDSIRKRCKPPILTDGGWHFSSVGNFDQIWEKLNSYAHANEGRVKKRLSKESIQNRIKQGLHPFKDGKKPGKLVDYNKLPECIKVNPDYYLEKGFLFNGHS